MATRHRMSRNPLSPQVPRLRLVEYRLDYLLGLMAVEAVATGETGITYRVSWGIETTGTPEPPKTVEAETRPSNNLLGHRLTFGTHSDYPCCIPAERPFKHSGRFLTSAVVALEAMTGARDMREGVNSRDGREDARAISGQGRRWPGASPSGSAAWSRAEPLGMAFAGKKERRRRSRDSRVGGGASRCKKVIRKLSVVPPITRAKAVG